MATTQEEYRRITEGLADMQRRLEKELRYLPHQRRQQQVAYYEARIEKLTAILARDYALNPI